MALSDGQKWMIAQKFLSRLVSFELSSLSQLEDFLKNFNPSTIKTKLSQTIQKEIDNLKEVKAWVDKV